LGYLGGPYGALAGHDGTRALGTMQVNAVKDEYDDHSDMTADDLNDAKDWEDRFQSMMLDSRAQYMRNILSEISSHRPRIGSGRVSHRL